MAAFMAASAVLRDLIRFSTNKSGNFRDIPVLPLLSHPTEHLPNPMRNSLLLTASLFLLVNRIGGFVAIAQSPESTPTETIPAELSDAKSLRVPARLGIGHNSSSAGFDGITGIQGFVPMGQNPGETLTFLDLRLLLDNGGHWGGNLALGYRDFDGDRHRITGGYIGVDSRSTRESTFYQLGAGFESLGNWDFRINGYLPLGDTSNKIKEIDIDTGLLTTSGFQGNQLVLNSQRQRQRVLQIEDALRGADAEVGGRLAHWQGGDLRGYGGVYIMDGDKTDGFIGGKLRLAANFTPNFNAGLALQHDGEFGTNLAFSIGASLPGLRSAQRTEFPEEVPYRLRESLVRNPNVAIATQSKAEVFSENNTQVLQNPEEEQDYRFIHVTLGQGAGGTGTIERPFGSVEEAIALVTSDPATYSDGNTVIYVDGEGSVTPIQSFIIPPRSQVLSQGPEQYLAGLPFPGFLAEPVRLPFSQTNNYIDGIRVKLPLSGDGVFPIVSGGENLVTAGGDRTVLAGFQLQNAGQNAFVARGITNVELRNNRITGAGANGIFLDDVGGNVTLFDNEISGAVGRGIYAENRSTLQAVDLAIAGYQLSDNGIGMEFAALASPGNTPSQIISIAPSSTTNTSVGLVNGGLLNNSILNSSQTGLLIRAEGSILATASSQEVRLDQGTISSNGTVGMQVQANQGGGSQEVSITNSTVSNNGGAGISVLNGTDDPGTTAYSQEIFVRGNQINNNGASGLDIGLNSAGSQELTLDNNRITDNSGDGIRSVAAVAGLQEWPTNTSIEGAGISNNEITGNGGQAIKIEARDAATIAVLNILNNRLQGQSSGMLDIDVAAVSPSVTACVITAGNVAPSGIALTTLSLDPNTQATFFVRSRDLLSSLNNNAPVQLLNSVSGSPEPSAFIDVNDACIP